MNFDALTLAAICAELQQQITPGRVQQVLLTGPHSLGFELYTQGTRRYLLVSAAVDDPRVHLVSDKLRRGPQTETPLLLLLRKYARDALLAEVRQPDPAERLLELHFSHREHGATTLVIELIGRFTNLLLLNEGGTILDCLVRVPPGARGGRTLLSGRPYVHPPRPEKLPPLDDGEADYYARLARVPEAEGLLSKALVAQVAGISPAQAQEIAWRATGDAAAEASAAALPALVNALQELWLPVRTGAWSPGVWLRDGRVVGCSPWVAHSQGEFAPRPGMSAAVEEAAEQKGPAAPVHGDAWAVQRRAVADLIRKASARLARQISAAEADLPAPGAADTLRTHAGWLLALHHTIAPGQTELVVATDSDEESDSRGDSTGAQLVIPVDPTVPPVEQAQALFRKAAKLERAAAVVPVRRAQLEADREYMAQLETDLAMAQSQPEIAAVRAELAAANLLPPQPQGKKQPRPPRMGPRLFLAPDGSRILVGRNARQNDELTFDTAKPADTWLHVRGAPGSHVLVQARGNGDPSAQTLLLAAQLAGYYSSLRDENAVDVIFTKKRLVNRVPGGRPGQVILRGEETLRVPAQLPAELAEVE